MTTTLLAQQAATQDSATSIHTYIYIHSLKSSVRKDNSQTRIVNIDKCRLSVRWLPTHRPSRSTWAMSPPVGCYHPHPPSVHACLCFRKHSPDGVTAATGRHPYKCCLLLIYQPQRDERLSWPSWLTNNGWVTHISGQPSAMGRAWDKEVHWP